MTTVTLDNRQLRRIMRKLDQLDKPALKRRAMEKAVRHYRSVIAEYPPQTGANVPPGLNGYSWYVRGDGTHTITGRVYRTSEDLGPSWRVEVAADGETGRVYNNTTYGEWVQDKRKQTEFHRVRGWKNTDDTLNEETRTIEGFFWSEYNAALETR